jgi:hypothetical protein
VTAMKWSCLLVATLALGCSGEPRDAGEPSADAFPEAPYATLKTDHGALTIEVRTSPQPPSRGIISVEYTMTDTAGRRRDDLGLAVVPWMPDMGHGASTEPAVEAKGDGRYVVSRLSLFMPGRWELRTTISGLVEDSATVGLQIP